MCDDSTPHDERARPGGGRAGRLRGAESGPAACGRQDNAAYLESSRKHCDREKGEEEKSSGEARYEVVSIGCRSWFCPRCCVGRGLRVREKLIPILQTFTGLQMWTLTLDPQVFSSPGEAFDYVRDQRCVSRLMRDLKRRGFLHTDRYFVVVEWQRETQMPHWHVVTDASFIPFETVCELWNRFRPASAGPVQGKRPGFGSVRFSAPRFADARHAACYACKYLIKHPEHGYPEWVLQQGKRKVHRYSTSRGFWGEAGSPELPQGEDDPVELVDDSGDVDQCPACGYEADGACDHCPMCGWSVLDESQLPEDETVGTIADQIGGCGSTSAVLAVVDAIDPATGELSSRRNFVGLLPVCLNVVAERLRRKLDEGVRRLDLMPADVSLLGAAIGFCVRGGSDGG